MSIKVLVADDHQILREGLVTLLGKAGMNVVGEAADGRTVVRLARELKPHVVIMDIAMPELNGIEATRRIRESHPQVRVLVLTSFATDDKIFPAIKAGAQGYLMKDTGPAELLEAIQRVQRGEPTLHPAIAQKLLAEISGPSSQPPTPDPLTKRELKVLHIDSSNDYRLRKAIRDPVFLVAEDAAGAAAHDVELLVGGDQRLGDERRHSVSVRQQRIVAQGLGRHGERVDDGAEAGGGADAEGARGACGVAAL